MRTIAAFFAMAFVLSALTASAETAQNSLLINEEKVYADLPITRVDVLLQQLADAGGFELKLTGGFDAMSELHANGTPLYRVLDNIVPLGTGYAFESDALGKKTRLVIFSSDITATPPAATNETQANPTPPPEKADDDTVQFMHATLANRELVDTPSKLTAIQHLAKIDSDRAVATLQAGIGDPDVTVRLATANALYEAQGDKAMTLIGQIYYDEGSASIRKDLAALVFNSTHPLARALVIDSGM